MKLYSLLWALIPLFWIVVCGAVGTSGSRTTFLGQNQPTGSKFSCPSDLVRVAHHLPIVTLPIFRYFRVARRWDCWIWCECIRPVGRPISARRLHSRRCTTIRPAVQYLRCFSQGHWCGRWIRSAHSEWRAIRLETQRSGSSEDSVYWRTGWSHCVPVLVEH